MLDKNLFTMSVEEPPAVLTSILDGGDPVVSNKRYTNYADCNNLGDYQIGNALQGNASDCA